MNNRKQVKEPYQMKGINALFGTDTEETVDSESIQSVPFKDIELPSKQPRRYFDAQKQASLVESIREHGILQPLIVRYSPQENGKYELVAGERRYRAGITLKLKLAPVIVRALTDEQSFLLALLENLQREDLNPVEETEAILQLLESHLQLDVEEISNLLNSAANKDRQSVNNVIHSEQWQKLEAIFTDLGKLTPNSFRVNRLPLLKLPKTILDALREGKIEYTKAKAIAKVKDEENRAELLEEAIAQELSLNQIRERLRLLESQELDKSTPTAQKTLNETYEKLKKAQLWKKDPKKWHKAQTLLKKLEQLLESDSDETAGSLK